MTFRLTAFDTTACQGFVISKIVQALEEAWVEGELNSLPALDDTAYGSAYHLQVVTGRPGKIIPSFLHPMLLTVPGNKDQVAIVIDERAAGKWSDNTMNFQIRNRFEFDFMAIYGLLNHYWVHGNPNFLLQASPLPTALYARWISENVTRRFGLDPQEQLSIAIVSTYFYLRQFSREDQSDILKDTTKLQRLTNQITRATYASADRVLEVLHQLDGNLMASGHDLVAGIRDVLQNVRLQNFNWGMLITVLGSTWYGTNAAELAAVAIEFPPTWILLTWMSYNDRSYKNTAIAKMAARDKQHEVDLFKRSLTALLKDSAE